MDNKVREIKLTQGKVAIVDAEDYKSLVVHKWYAHTHHGNWYARRNTPDCKTLHMHRVILYAQKGEKIDHRNGNGLDNRRSNLRIATFSQNQFNAKRSKTNKSGFKGVSALYANGKPTKRWKAAIRCEGQVTWLGVFDDPKDAARAYDRKAIELFGEFARPNFPGEARNE